MCYLLLFTKLQEPERRIKKYESCLFCCVKCFALGLTAVVTNCLRGRGHSRGASPPGSEQEILVFSGDEEGVRGVAKTDVWGEKKSNSRDGHGSDRRAPSSAQQTFLEACAGHFAGLWKPGVGGEAGSRCHLVRSLL